MVGNVAGILLSEKDIQNCLLQWLLARNCKDVCMESTGKYWIPIYNILEKDCSIVLVHPKYIKDARWIADLFPIK